MLVQLALDTVNVRLQIGFDFIQVFFGGHMHDYSVDSSGLVGHLNSYLSHLNSYLSLSPTLPVSCLCSLPIPVPKSPLAMWLLPMTVSLPTLQFFVRCYIISLVLDDFGDGIEGGR